MKHIILVTSHLGDKLTGRQTNWATRFGQLGDTLHGDFLHLSSVFEMYFNIFELKVICAFCFMLVLYLEQITVTVKLYAAYIHYTAKPKHQGCTGDCNIYETAVVTSQTGSYLIRFYMQMLNCCYFIQHNLIYLLQIQQKHKTKSTHHLQFKYIYLNTFQKHLKNAEKSTSARVAQLTKTCRPVGLSPSY